MNGQDKDAVRERDRQFVIRSDGAVFPPSTRQDGIAAIRDRNCLLDALDTAEAERDRWVKIAERLDSDMEALAANAQRADDRAERLARQVETVRALHLHIYPPEDPDDVVIVQLHDRNHHVLRTYQRGIDGFIIALSSTEGPEQ